MILCDLKPTRDTFRVLIHMRFVDSYVESFKYSTSKYNLQLKVFRIRRTQQYTSTRTLYSYSYIYSHTLIIPYIPVSYFIRLAKLAN